MNLRTKQLLGIAGVAGALFGLLVLPILLNRLYGVDTIQVLFVVVVFYATLSWWMKNRN